MFSLYADRSETWLKFKWTFKFILCVRLVSQDTGDSVNKVKWKSICELFKNPLWNGRCRNGDVLLFAVRICYHLSFRNAELYFAKCSTGLCIILVEETCFIHVIKYQNGKANSCVSRSTFSIMSRATFNSNKSFRVAIDGPQWKLFPGQFSELSAKRGWAFWLADR